MVLNRYKKNKWKKVSTSKSYDPKIMKTLFPIVVISFYFYIQFS